MNQFIRNFKITRLFGYRDINITFNNDVMIVIGENGLGKTTILNALAFTLLGEWKKLNTIIFDTIQIKTHYRTFEFSHDLLSVFCAILDNPNVEVINKLAREKEEFHISLSDLYLIDKYKRNLDRHNPFPTAIFPESTLESTTDFSIFEKLTNHVKTFGSDYEREIMYLPTYRRIEVDLESIENLHLQRRIESPLDEKEHRFSSYHPLFLNKSPFSNDAIIQFGMEDVLKGISTITNTISQSFITGYAEASGDMIRQLLKNDKHDKHELTFDYNQIKIILARIGNYLSKEEKDHILEMVDSRSQELLDNTTLVYFLEQLLSVYQKQERYDSAIKDFCNVCNKYLKEKQFVYDESNVSLQLFRKINGELLLNKENEVQLKHLSSGEKQIVSIFAHVYLNVDKRFIVLIDEPELSLSIFWQEQLIPDLIASKKCDFIMAVTHSPFIFGEELKDYTIGINEFFDNK